MDFINSFIQWFSDHPEILMGLGISSIFIFLLSILGISWFVANIPEDYFLEPKRRPTKWREQKPILRLAIIFVKNVIGLLLIVGGVLPGQGLLTMITGLLLINYPGKYRLEQKLVSKPSIFRALNWIRIKANKPPLNRNTTH
jgi:hypothetical protein